MSPIRLLLLSAVVIAAGCAAPFSIGNYPETAPALPSTGERLTAFDRWKQARLAETDPRFVAGAAVVDLTPLRSRSVFMAGYAPNKLSVGTIGRITGRVALFDDGRNTVVIIGLDFVGVLNHVVADMRTAITGRHGDSVLIASVHNHSGPDTLGLWGRAILYVIPVQSGIDQGYLARVRQRLADAVAEAARTARPAVLVAAAGEVPPGISINAHGDKGNKDDEMVVVQARGSDGRAIATIVNYAVHVEFMGPENYHLSPDVCGPLYDRLERNEGGVALFLNGAIGGIIVPDLPFFYDVRRRVARTREAGFFLADFASGLLTASGESFTPATVGRTAREIRLPLENATFRAIREMDFFRDRRVEGDDIFTEVWRIDLGRLQLAGVPGEVFPSIGRAIKGRMAGPYRMLVGLANDELGYIMTEEEYRDPAYAYETTVSVGPRAGTAVLQAVEALFPAD